MDKTEALLGHFRKIAALLEIEARDYESGCARQLKGNMDVSADSAASLRHRAANILAVIEAFRRLTARESKKTG
jgi:hypothetical protein